MLNSLVPLIVHICRQHIYYNSLHSFVHNLLRIRNQPNSSCNANRFRTGKRTEVVADHVVHPGLCTVQFQCDEVAVLIHVIPQRAAVSGGFGDQTALEVVVKMSGCAGDGLFDPSAERDQGLSQNFCG